MWRNEGLQHGKNVLGNTALVKVLNIEASLAHKLIKQYGRPTDTQAYYYYYIHRVLRNSKNKILIAHMHIATTVIS